MKRILAALLCWLFLLWNSAAQADPAIWKVQGKHNTVYLLGTIHVLPREQALPANVRAIYNQTRELWLEVDLQGIDPMALQDTMQRKGLLPADQSLMNLLDAETRSSLARTARQLDLSTDLLARFQPWLAALTLEMTQYAASGFVTDNGVDLRLSQLANEDHKKTHGFETLTEQLDLFASLDQKAQIALLKQTLQELNENNSELADLEAAWLAGDEARLAQSLQDGFDEDPVLLESLTTRRNQRWLARIKPVLNEQTSDAMVAVGALHLVGDHGLVALLRQAGYQVTRQ